MANRHRSVLIRSRRSVDVVKNSSSSASSLGNLFRHPEHLIAMGMSTRLVRVERPACPQMPQCLDTLLKVVPECLRRKLPK